MRRRGLLILGLAALALSGFIAAPDSAAPRCFGKKATIVGTNRNDRLIGTAGVDVIVALAGNDRVTSRGGNDMICGGEGSDILVPGLGNDRVDGGGKSDLIRYKDSPSPVHVDLSAGTGVGEGLDQLTSLEQVEGSSFDDILTGDEDANVLAGGSGHDTVTGLGGNDSLVGGVRQRQGPGTSCIEGSGEDALSGGDGRDWLLGCDGNDVLTGGPGSDRLIGGDDFAPRFMFNDKLCEPAGSGQDILDGGEGNDFLAGCDDADTLDGGGGTDQVLFSGAEGPVVVDLASGTSTGEGSDNLISIEDASGSDFGDTIVGNDGDNRLDGGYVHGNGPSDSIVGGFGNDSISGGNGNDVLTGGVHDDDLDGGTGRDLVRLFTGYFVEDDEDTSGLTVDLVLGTSVGDGIDSVSGIEDIVAIDMHGGLEHTLTGDDDSNRIIGTGGFDSIEGRGGDDYMYGGLSRDVIKGGDGDDTVDGGPQRDEMDGGEGFDLCLGFSGFDSFLLCEGP